VIFISYLLRLIKDTFPENELVQKTCIALIIFFAVLSILGAIAFISSLAKNTKEMRLASTHYDSWFEQLPPEHILKQNNDGLDKLYEMLSVIGITTGSLIDTQKEMIKYEFGKLDITELGILEAYLSKKFDESKPEYLLIDAETMKTLKKIKIEIGQTKSIKLYRNEVELSFDYVPPKNIRLTKGKPKLDELISLGFVKAYIQDPDIAKISSNQITALAKGKTKLILFYGTQLLEQDVIIK
jgi:hypothetical protein